MSKRVGVILAVGHTLLFLFFLLYLNLAVDDGQSRLLWALWLPIDFPISLLVPFILDAVPRDSEFRGIIISYLPHIIHGFLGAIWWFCIGLGASFIFSRVGASSRR